MPALDTHLGDLTVKIERPDKDAGICSRHVFCGKAGVFHGFPRRFKQQTLLWIHPLDFAR